jgi:hypothetical protein
MSNTLFWTASLLHSSSTYGPMWVPLKCTDVEQLGQHSKTSAAVFWEGITRTTTSKLWRDSSIWISSHKIWVQLVTNMESVFTKTLLIWKNGTEGCRALTCCQITAGVLSGKCLRLITNGQNIKYIIIITYYWINIWMKIMSFNYALLFNGEW